MEKYFYCAESPYNIGKFIIYPTHEKFHIGMIMGSYSVFQARILNMTWANYLRYCRDVHKATIIGKGHLYPVPYFDKEPKELLKILNMKTNEMFKRLESNISEHEREGEEESTTSI
jgi:hypothetical protein